MRMINTFQLGANDYDEKAMPVGDHSWPEHRVCTRLIDEVKYSLANASGGNINLTRAQMLDIISKEFAEWSMSFGLVQEEKVDTSRSFAQMRVLAYFLTGHDACTVNGTELADYVDGTVVANNGANTAITFEFIRPFIFERFAGAGIDEWCPGKTQMEQLRVNVKRGAALSTAGLSKNGTSTHTIFGDTSDGENKWANVPRLQRTNQSGFAHTGPAGALIGLVEMTKIGTGTDLVTVSLKRDGDEDIYTSVDAKRIARNASLKVPQGSKDPNTLGCVLFQPEEQTDLNGLTTAKAFTFEQADSYIAGGMDLLWVFVPAITDNYRDNVIGQNVTAEEKGAGKQVLGVTGPAYRGETIDGHVTAVSAVHLVRPGNAKFNLLAGRLFERNQPAKTNIPEDLAKAVKSTVSGLSGDAAVSKLAQEAKNVAKAIPGGRSPERGAATPLMNVLTSILAPNDTLASAARNLIG